MALFKKLLLLSLLTGAYPGLLHGMDQETPEAILQRSQQSGYLGSMYKNMRNEAYNFSNQQLIKFIEANDWNSVVDNILAGCNLECLFNNETVTEDNIATICGHLKRILDNKKDKWKTNETDYTRITKFLQHGLNSKKVTRTNLFNWFPPNTKNVHLILGPLQDPPLPSNINTYKILLPVAAVITVAAIGYKWWSKHAEEEHADDKTDDHTAPNGKDEIAQTLQ